MIAIPRSIVERIEKHAREAAPIEACGILLGSGVNAVEQYRMTNVDNSADHFTFAPTEQFAAVRLARSKGLSQIAVYHSHPASPARPSEEDIRLAFDSSVSYVIMSLAGEAPVIKSFVISNGKAVEEELRITSDVPREHDEFSIYEAAR